jgi:hypothetical protein
LTDPVSVPENKIACKTYEDKLVKITKEPSYGNKYTYHETFANYVSTTANCKSSATQYSVSVMEMKPYQENLLPGSMTMNLTLSGSVEIKALKLTKLFEIQQQKLQYNDNTVDLNSPLLQKKKSPYVVELKLRCKGRNNIQIQTRNCSRNVTCTNKDGTIKIKSVGASRLTGIKGLNFQNFSNRDTANDYPQPMRDDTESFPVNLKI